MEKSTSLQLILAAAPDTLNTIHSPDTLIAHMAYRIADGPTLYRCAAPERLQGGILMAQDEGLQQIGSSEFLCRQAVRECRARGFLGFIANWSTPPTAQLCRVTSELEQALLSAQLEYWVAERYAKCVKNANILISSAISGGTLRQRLIEAMERYGQHRVTLAIERMAEDFTLPAQNGSGTPLTQEQLNALKQRIHPSVYYSSELCAHYFTYSTRGEVHFVLFDTDSSIRRKLALAQELGGRYALAAAAEFSLSPPTAS